MADDQRDRHHRQPAADIPPPGQQAGQTADNDDGLTLAERRIRQAQREGQFDNLRGAGRATELPPLVRLLDAQGLAEQRIQQAISDGLFDNLPGAGKPLDLDDDLYIPDEMKMAYRVMKAQGLKPVWIELREEWREGYERYKRWHAALLKRWPKLNNRQRQEELASLRSQIGALNSLIHNINATVPTDSLRLGLLTYEHESAGLS